MSQAPPPSPAEPPAPQRRRRTDAEILELFRVKGAPHGVSRLLGFELTVVDQAGQRIEAAFRAGPELCNPIGTVQGGILTAMLDELMSFAAIASSGLSIVVPTLEIKTSYVRPAKPGRLTGWGHVVRMGRAVAFLEGALLDAEGQLVATASATAMVQPRPPRAPKAA